MWIFGFIGTIALAFIALVGFTKFVLWFERAVLFKQPTESYNAEPEDAPELEIDIERELLALVDDEQPEKR